MPTTLTSHDKEGEAAREREEPRPDRHVRPLLLRALGLGGGIDGQLGAAGA